MATRKKKPPEPIGFVQIPVPPPGQDRRHWIKWALSKRANPATGRRWTPADVAAEAYAAESTVSLVYLGERTVGKKIEKIMRITARVLEMKTLELFGIVLDSGDGYVGDELEVAP
jgi:hypothetical protein